MPMFDIDVTLKVTHTETFEAEDLESAKQIYQNMLDDEDFTHQMLSNIMEDEDAFDISHLTFNGPEESDLSDPDDVTIDEETIELYL